MIHMLPSQTHIYSGGKNPPGKLLNTLLSILFLGSRTRLYVGRSGSYSVCIPTYENNNYHRSRNLWGSKFIINDRLL